MRLHALLIPILLCLPLAGQSKGRPTPKKPTSAPALWQGALLGSKAFEGELKSDQEVFIEDDILMDEAVQVDPRPTRVAWRVKGETEPEAKMMFVLLDADRILNPMGLVRITNADLKQYQHSYRNFPDLAFLSQRGLIYRPKDEARFRQILDQVTLIGDRHQGRMSALINQLFVVLEPREFSFNQGKALFSIRISTVLYGGYWHQGEPPQAGPLDESSRSTQPLIREVRGKFLEDARLLMKLKSSPTTAADPRPEAPRD